MYPNKARRIGRDCSAPAWGPLPRNQGMVNAGGRWNFGRDGRLRRSERVAQAQPGTQELLRVDCVAVDARFVMQVRTG